MRPATLLSSLAALACAAPLGADTIFKTDGDVILDVTVKKDLLSGVEYEKDRDQKSLPAEQVLSIEYSYKPQAVDRADTAIDEGNLLDAQADLEGFLAGLESAPRKWPWSRAYAQFRLMEVFEMMGEVGPMVAAADRLVGIAPDSRLAPIALLRKAQALQAAGQAGDAGKSLAELSSFIQAKSLGDDWKLQHELQTILMEGSSGADRRRKLEALSDRAGSRYPTVRNRADVAVAESLIASGKIEEAEKILEGVTDDPLADDRTLAAAFTALGDCKWTRGEGQAGSDAGKELLKQALLAYMRVVVVYDTQHAYVPKAMFFAMRCIQLIGGETAEADATKLYRKIVTEYRDTRWASDARSHNPTKK